MHIFKLTATAVSVVGIVVMGSGPCAAENEAPQVAEEFRPDQSHLPVPPPADAIVLFDGRGTNLFVSMSGKEINWPVVEGTLVSTRGNRRANHIVSRVHFRDADIHVEFLLPGGSTGNSGIYIHGLYEMQIYNSYGKSEPGMHDMGSLYRFAPALVNAARPPGKWQVYDIRYRAPRRNEEGKITTPGRITAWLNGRKVQDGTEFGEPRSPYHPYRYGTTPYLQEIWRQQKRTGIGPLFLQDHDSPVRFRNVWIRPLDDQVVICPPPAACER